MLVLKRHYQFWFAINGLHKLGAIAILASNQLKDHDFEYRFNAAGISAILCTADGDVADEAEKAIAATDTVKTKIIVNGEREGWHSFNEEYSLFSGKFERTEDSPCGNDPMLMFFTSGTTGYPKIAVHQLQVPARAPYHREILALCESRRTSPHDIRYRMGESDVGQALRSVALRGGTLRIRFRPLPRG